ncbi:MAG TPA: hypothetical protein VJ770_01145, partial [Stellaceae bacterium]|nr:hypothetical protein [Stellaceae bacterium]
MSGARREGLPSVGDLVAFIRDSPEAVGRREIARAFGIGPGDRRALGDMLRAVERAGAVARAGNRRFVAGLPPQPRTAVPRGGRENRVVTVER